MGALWHGAENLLKLFLEQFYSLTGSYGCAIVILTVLIRLLLYPLNKKQMISMQAMQKIQPRLKMLQEKYADDKQKLGEETMRLYKEYKVNPMAGCMPMLVQLPILILLFQVLRKHNFGDATFLGIFKLGSTAINGICLACSGTGSEKMMVAFKAIFANPAGLANVSMYIGNIILLLSIIILTWAQQKMTAGDNPQMATMNTIMPIFMGWICLSMPGGVMIYWGLSTLFGVVQQYYVMKNAKLEMANKPALHKNKPTTEVVEEDDDDEYEWVEIEDDEE